MRYSDFQEAIRELDWRTFEAFIVDAVIAMGRFSEVQPDVVIRGSQIDLIATEADTLATRPAKWFFEIKARRNRVGSQDIGQLAALSHSLSDMGSSCRFVLVTNSPPTAHAREMAQRLGIEVWDPMALLRIVPDDVLRKYFGHPSGEVEPDTDLLTKGDALIRALTEILPGRSGWPQYQRLISEVLDFLFCPPLEKPLGEMPDFDRRNRRDVILENGASDGFWARLRSTYEAHYVVADAKNYLSPLRKTPVLDVAHYLKPHGCGMFGLILSRCGAGPAAEHAVREQWVAARKLILVLSDEDVTEMIRQKIEAGDPDTLLRRRIAEFRISL